MHAGHIEIDTPVFLFRPLDYFGDMRAKTYGNAKVTEFFDVGLNGFYIAGFVVVIRGRTLMINADGVQLLEGAHADILVHGHIGLPDKLQFAAVCMLMLLQETHDVGIR